MVLPSADNAIAFGISPGARKKCARGRRVSRSQTRNQRSPGPAVAINRPLVEKAIRCGIAPWRSHGLPTRAMASGGRGKLSRFLRKRSRLGNGQLGRRGRGWNGWRRGNGNRPLRQNPDQAAQAKYANAAGQANAHRNGAQAGANDSVGDDAKPHWCRRCTSRDRYGCGSSGGGDRIRRQNSAADRADRDAAVRQPALAAIAWPASSARFDRPDRTTQHLCRVRSRPLFDFTQDKCQTKRLRQGIDFAIDHCAPGPAERRCPPGPVREQECRSTKLAYGTAGVGRQQNNEPPPDATRQRRPRAGERWPHVGSVRETLSGKRPRLRANRVVAAGTCPRRGPHVGGRASRTR